MRAAVRMMLGIMRGAGPPNRARSRRIPTNPTPRGRKRLTTRQYRGESRCPHCAGGALTSINDHGPHHRSVFSGLKHTVYLGSAWCIRNASPFSPHTAGTPGNAIDEDRAQDSRGSSAFCFSSGEKESLEKVARLGPRLGSFADRVRPW